MNYRSFGNTGGRVSALGFGAMRFPTKGTQSDIDEARAIEMLRYAIDRGVNYIDTAYVYHGGRSETVVGKALSGGYREKVQVATKLPIWNVHNVEDCDGFLKEQLARLQTDHIDLYLFHCLQRESWPKLRDLGGLQWAVKARADGRIGRIGFSFHDTNDVLVEILDEYDWSFCQIQYNFVDEDVQAGAVYAAAKGLGVVVMEPLFGGTLANPPPPIREIWDRRQSQPADLALRWLWSKPWVSLVLSGMSNLEQVEQNIRSACRAGVGNLDPSEAALVARLQEEYGKLSPIPCTRCGYCMPCPRGVNIPVNFELYNNVTLFQGISVVLCQNRYGFLPEAERAGACVACGTCDEKCPQGIEIGKTMGQVREQFEAGWGAGPEVDIYEIDHQARRTSTPELEKRTLAAGAEDCC
jgi:predicted aldo/keto reductase-like oxidoreductase